MVNPLTAKPRAAGLDAEGDSPQRPKCPDQPLFPNTFVGNVRLLGEHHAGLRAYLRFARRFGAEALDEAVSKAKYPALIF